MPPESTGVTLVSTFLSRSFEIHGLLSTWRAFLVLQVFELLFRWGLQPLPQYWSVRHTWESLTPRVLQSGFPCCPLGGCWTLIFVRPTHQPSIANAFPVPSFCASKCHGSPPCCLSPHTPEPCCGHSWFREDSILGSWGCLEMTQSCGAMGIVVEWLPLTTPTQPVSRK